MLSRHALIVLTFSFIGIVLLYILIRCLNLTYLPYFGDEAEYMWYAYTALHDPAQRFISLEVGKQPLFIWLTMFYIQFTGTPLLAGRLVSVTAGLLTMLGVWFLTFRLFNNRSLSYIAATVFIFSPFAELINRLGNFDSTVGMFYIWSLFFTVLLVQTVRLDVAYTLGLSLAGGILTKSSAFFSLYLLPVAFILFDFTNHHYRRRFITLLILFGVAVLLAYSLYSLLQLSPYYERIAWFNGSFVYPKREWLHLDTGFRLALFRDNLFVLSDYFVYYITLPFLAFIPLALWFGRQHMRVLLLLLAYSFLPLLALAVFGRGIGSRWIYPFTLPLIPVIAHGLHSVIIVLWQRRKIYHPGVRRILVPSLVIAAFLYPIMQTLTLAVNPQSANIHPADRLQYISCATWAIRDIVADLDRRTHNHRLLIGSRFPLGSGQQTGQIISLYALSNRNIIVKGFDMTLPSYPATLGHYSSVMPTYVIFYKEWAKTMGVPGTRLKLIKELPSAYDNRCSTVQLYKVV